MMSRVLVRSFATRPIAARPISNKLIAARSLSTGRVVKTTKNIYYTENPQVTGIIDKYTTTYQERAESSEIGLAMFTGAIGFVGALALTMFVNNISEKLHSYLDKQHKAKKEEYEKEMQLYEKECEKIRLRNQQQSNDSSQQAKSNSVPEYPNCILNDDYEFKKRGGTIVTDKSNHLIITHLQGSGTNHEF